MTAVVEVVLAAEVVVEIVDFDVVTAEMVVVVADAFVEVVDLAVVVVEVPAAEAVVVVAVVVVVGLLSVSSAYTEEVKV